MSTAHPLQRAEQLVLIALAFVLPMLEAPKNLLWLAYVVLWIANRVRERDFGARWDGIDTLIVMWIASAYAAVAFGGLTPRVWGAPNDIVRYASVLLLLRRSRYADAVWLQMVLAIVAGTLLTLAWGYYGVYGSRARQSLGLKSVGHVNHSAIYLVIVFGLCLAMLRSWWHHLSRVWKFAGLACLAVCVQSLLLMESRAALGAAFVVAVTIPAAYSVRLRHGFRMVVLGAMIAVGAILAVKPVAVERAETHARQNAFFYIRDAIWNVGLQAWRANQWFGVGMDNFERISHDRLRQWRAARSEPYDPARVILASHAHSLYVNTLAERGLAGLFALLAVLATWFVALLHRVPPAQAPPIEWTLWGGAASAWLVAVIVGLVNTTLHHEHALLSMLLAGAWCSYERARRTRT